MNWLWLFLGLFVLAGIAWWLVMREERREAAELAAAEASVLAAPDLVVRTKPLTGIPAIRRFFRTNRTPVYFVSATAFNLLGIDRWVPSLRYINYYDSFDGWHPNVFVPKEQTPRSFASIEEIVNYLLGHKEVADLVASRGEGGKAAFLMFDEETEQLAAELGLEVAFPPASLRHRLDSKIETTRLGNDAGVPSVPNAIALGTTYKELLALADHAELGHDLVVQTPYGDSGQTTFFIAREDDWRRDEKKIAGQAIKVMKRIEPRELAIEGVITRHGTLVGPLMAELVGFEELTPYDGGWCGDDVSPELLTEEQRRIARRHTIAMGDRLRAEGYRGYFELDFLLDADTGDIWLGELNPRVTGASSITNVTAVAYGDMPLFLFHLLEFMDVEYEIDVEELNDRWAQVANLDEWTQFILKQTEDVTELITAAPASGIWRMRDGGGIRYARRDTDWHTVADETEAFYLRIAGAGQYRYAGADLGILVTRGRFMDADHGLLDRARGWIDGIKHEFASVPPAAEAPPVHEPEPFGFKLL
ncbi:MAG TPA: biotin carboxylase [Actinomycetota bacterium]|nr:biotin carboxylase [Actinomycetota bacterium]